MTDYPPAIAGYTNETQMKEQAYISHRDTTVAQNIDRRIASLLEEVERLKAVKAKLSNGSILDVSIHDLRAAMNA